MTYRITAAAVINPSDMFLYMRECSLSARGAQARIMAHSIRISAGDKGATPALLERTASISPAMHRSDPAAAVFAGRGEKVILPVILSVREERISCRAGNASESIYADRKDDSAARGSGDAAAARAAAGIPAMHLMAGG